MSNSDPQGESNESTRNGPSGRAGPADGPPVDLDIHVQLSHLHGETELTYTLHSPSGNASYHHDSIEGVRIKGRPEEYWRQLIDRIESLAGKRDVDDSGLSGAEVVRHLEGIGHDLFHELFSRPLRQEYLGFRKTVQSLQITSEEPWIPWELIKPFDSDLGIDDDFLCIQFQLTRWLSGNRTAPRLIEVTNLACVEAGMVKGRPPLPLARREKKMLSALASASPGGELHSPQRSALQDVIHLLEKGGNHLIHFVSHGDFDPARPNQSEIMLADGKSLRAHDLQGSIENRLKADQPLVFLNACRVGALSWSLTGLGGWAERWVRRCGCSAFVGPLWSVTDHNAYAFAMGFYRFLQQGKTIGEAVQLTRRMVRKRSPHDPTWLAYSVYAHPNARLVFGRESRPEKIQPLSDSSPSTEVQVEAEFHRSLDSEVQQDPFDIPQPSPSKETVWKRIAGFASQHPAWTAIGTVLLAVLLAVGLLWLGQQSHREREYLLQVGALEYPIVEFLVTGAEALYSLPQKAIAAPFLGNLVITVSSIVLIAITVVWLWLARRSRAPASASKSRRSLPVGVRLALLGLTAFTLTMGSLFYALAIQATDPFSAKTDTLADCPTPRQGDPDSAEPARAGLIEQMTFETCSWLRNDSEQNNGRRESLNGLILWLLAALGSAAWAGWRIPAPRGWKHLVQRGLAAVQLLAFLFLASWLPSAHAYGKWGLRYPEVKGISAGCDDELLGEIQKEGTSRS
ncbi:MAG: CHAT domain-containing protein, partial [Acidobacteriota bacterium]